MPSRRSAADSTSPGWSRPATSWRTCPCSTATAGFGGASSTVGPRTCTPVADVSTIPPVAHFRVDFLGCKVSHVDAHEIRERLLADGHAEAGDDADVAVISTCCVTNEAVAKSRKAAARAARTHRRVYLTGCAANLAGNALGRL